MLQIWNRYFPLATAALLAVVACESRRQSTDRDEQSATKHRRGSVPATDEHTSDPADTGQTTDRSDVDHSEESRIASRADTEQPKAPSPADQPDSSRASEQSGSTDQTPPCEAPVLWLATYTFDEFEAAYARECQSPPTQQVAWDALEPPSQWTFDCREYAYAINALRMWHGKSPEDPRWLDYFRDLSWFRGFPEREFSEAARQNLELFRQKRQSCEKKSSVTDRDREFLRTWFDRLHAPGDTAQVPDVGMADGKLIGRSDIRDILDLEKDLGNLNYTLRTPVSASPVSDGTVTLRDRTVEATRLLRVEPGLDADLSCIGGEDCEGYNTLVFYLDDDWNVVAFRYIAAACPFVAISTDESPWRRQGEILRALAGPELADWQTLDLDVPASAGQCPDELQVRIAEHKMETTRLDAVYLQVGDDTRRPRACRRASPAFCRPDHRSLHLSPGQSVTLTFDLSETTAEACRHVQLRAHGHYRPLGPLPDATGPAWTR